MVGQEKVLLREIVCGVLTGFIWHRIGTMAALVNTGMNHRFA
jgi:hypothetical protein